MQVLLALVAAGGDIVRREDLTERCWDGRVVGEDAINRVISRLRRVSETIGDGSFRIETISKVGYRLVLPEGEAPVSAPAPPSAAEPRAPRPTRRNLLLIGCLGAIGALGSGFAFWRTHHDRLPPAARAAMKRGMTAMRIGSPDQLAAAVAAFQEAADAAPGSAAPQAMLAVTHRLLSISANGDEASLYAARAREAADKALRIDPDNADAQSVLATLQPMFRNWLRFDAATAPILQRHPENLTIRLLCLDLCANVGRVAQVNALARTIVASDPDLFDGYSALMESSWCLNRLGDADDAMDIAFKRWPRQIGVWFSRQRLLAYTGRAAQALAMVEDEDHRPLGVPAWDFDLCRAECRALLTRTPADIDACAKLYWDQAHKSVGEAANAMQFLAAVGRLDDAFAVLDALYFNRGFDVGVRAFSAEQGTYSPYRNRQTWYFWLPYMAAMRADRRLGAFFEEIGLADYWRKSGHRPEVSVPGFTA